MACRHCKKPSAHARGLCSRCYYDPSIRILYPIIPVAHNHHGLALDNAEPPLPPHPTRTVPGSEERMLVLEWRAAHGYALFHPEDYVDQRNEWDYL